MAAAAEQLIHLEETIQDADVMVLLGRQEDADVQAQHGHHIDVATAATSSIKFINR